MTVTKDGNLGIQKTRPRLPGIRRLFRMHHYLQSIRCQRKPHPNHRPALQKRKKEQAGSIKNDFGTGSHRDKRYWITTGMEPNENSGIQRQEKNVTGTI